MKGSASTQEAPRDPHARVLTAPPRLVRGDRVAVVAPSGPADADKLARGLGGLEALGLVPVEGRHVRDRVGYLAGSDTDRLADLQWALDDPSVRAVLFARGGYGLSRIVDRLDMSAISRSPKVVVGFSDITLLALALAAGADLATVHGPMVGSNLGRERPHALTLAALRAVAGPDTPGGPALVLSRDDGLSFLGAARRVTAPLVGGCLSLLVASLGTPFEVATRGGILFWEDVGEDLYRLDRMLSHLRLAGKLDGIEAMLVGCPLGITRERREGPVSDLTEFLSWWLAEAPYPVVAQLPFGHGEPNVSLVVGGLATVDPASGTVALPCL